MAEIEQSEADEAGQNLSAAVKGMTQPATHSTGAESSVFLEAYVRKIEAKLEEKAALLTNYRIALRDLLDHTCIDGAHEEDKEPEDREAESFARHLLEDERVDQKPAAVPNEPETSREHLHLIKVLREAAWAIKPLGVVPLIEKSKELLSRGGEG